MNNDSESEDVYGKVMYSSDLGAASTIKAVTAEFEDDNSCDVVEIDLAYFDISWVLLTFINIFIRIFRRFIGWLGRAVVVQT